MRAENQSLGTREQRKCGFLCSLVPQLLWCVHSSKVTLAHIDYEKLLVNISNLLTYVELCCLEKAPKVNKYVLLKKEHFWIKSAAMLFSRKPSN